MKRLLVILGCLVALGAIVGTTLSAFSDQASNGGNSFDAASTFPGNLRMASGSFSGNGVDGRSINVGFKPDLVIVKASTTQIAYARTKDMPAGQSKPLTGATALATNRIKSLDATGFSLGTDTAVNGPPATIYTWQAFEADDAVLRMGTYTGNGGTRSVTGLGFVPEYVAVLPAAARASNQRYKDMTRSFRFDNDTGSTTRIANLDPLGIDGFSVGNNADLNTNAETYYYVAVNETAGSVKKGSYAGTGSGKPVTGVGFAPLYAMVRANDTATGRQGHQRSAATPASASRFFTNLADITTGITSLLGDGFQVSTDGAVNAAGGSLYHYLAFKHAGTGCPIPSVTLPATIDSRVEEANAGTNYGADTNPLRVASRAGANKRSLVQFALPSVPAGCAVSSAKLRLYNNVPAAGRTIEAVANGAGVPAQWTETGVTWTNKPPTTGSTATATVPTGGAAYLEWTVSPQVLAMYSGTANYGFRLKDATEGAGSTQQQEFNTRTGTNPPELVVTFG